MQTTTFNPFQTTTHEPTNHASYTTLGDKEILSLMLTQQKHLAEAYNHTASHTDDPELLQTLMNMLADDQKMRLRIYEVMHRRGWYNPKPIEQSQINQARETFHQSKQRLQNALNGLRPTSYSSGTQQPVQNQPQTFQSTTTNFGQPQPQTSSPGGFHQPGTFFGQGQSSFPGGS